MKTKLLPLFFAALIGAAHGQKITSLPSLPAASVDPAADVLEITDVSVPASKKITVSDILNSSGGVGGKADKTDLIWIDVTKPPYNAVGDGEYRSDGVISSGSATLTSATASFPTTIVGKYIRVEGAGAAGADLIGSVSTRNSSTSITLNVTASTSVASNAKFFWGTNNTTAINNAINDASTSTITRTVYFPPLKFLGNYILKRNVKMLGAYRGSNIESLFTYTQLADRNLTGTVLFPAVSTAPVIYANAGDTGEAFGSGVEGFVISGSAAKHGTGIQFGGVWGTLVNFTSGSLDINRCHIAGFDTAIKHNNAVEGDISFVHWNDCNTGVEIWKHDSITIRNCGSNNITGGNNFRIGAAKAVNIINGNYNNFARFVDMTDSMVHVGAVNVEHPTAEVFALRDASGEQSRLVVDYVKVLTSSTGVLVKDYYADANKQNVFVDIRAAQGNTNYYDTANSNTPLGLPVSYIRHYTDNTFTTLNYTEYNRRVNLTNEERKTCYILNESFTSHYAASPYGDLGWTATGISGSYAGGAANAPIIGTGGLRFYTNAGGGGDQLITNVGRWEAQTAQIVPANGIYFDLSCTLRDGQPNTAISRWGLYSRTANVKPNDGVGFYYDSTVSANIKLEVLNGGVQTLTDTGIPITAIAPANGAMTFTLQRGALGVSAKVVNSAGGLLAPEVIYSGTLPVWSGLHTTALYHGTNTATWQDITLGKMQFIQYPSSSF